MDLKNKKIGFAITGSFCTLKKALEMLRDLEMRECDIIPILSENVATTDTRFFMAQDFMREVEDICGKKPLTTIVESEPIGPKSLLDALIVAPCTGNTLAKICYGVTDSSVTMAVKAHLRNQKPVLLGVSTNDGLSNNAKNIGHLLNMKNVYFIPFGQDDAFKKCNSLVADFTKLAPSLEKALLGEQLQPVLI